MATVPIPFPTPPVLPPPPLGPANHEIILDGQSAQQIIDMVFEDPQAMAVIKLQEIFRKTCSGDFAVWLAGAIKGNPDIRTFAKYLVDNSSPTYGGLTQSPKLALGTLVSSSCVAGYYFVLYVKDEATGRVEWDRNSTPGSVNCKPLI